MPLAASIAGCAAAPLARPLHYAPAAKFSPEQALRLIALQFIETLLSLLVSALRQ
jgi:hypothetical protein